VSTFRELPAKVDALAEGQARNGAVLFQLAERLNHHLDDESDLAPMVRAIHDELVGSGG